jgi:hypothetical protein
VLTENEIVQTLAEHLRREGYRIDKQLTTLEQGVDIVAIHLATGRRLLVEAKGSTSSKEGTARFGKPFSPNQAKSHVSVAFYCGAKMLQKYAPEAAQVALAFPDDKDHRGFVDAISAALKRLAITVYFVDQNRQVRTLSPID